jgi:hypothetical protein
MWVPYRCHSHLRNHLHFEAPASTLPSGQGCSLADAQVAHWDIFNSSKVLSNYACTLWVVLGHLPIGTPWGFVRANCASSFCTCAPYGRVRHQEPIEAQWPYVAMSGKDAIHWGSSLDFLTVSLSYRCVGVLHAILLLLVTSHCQHHPLQVATLGI